MEPWTAEAIYDEQISPLMKQIIAICKEHKIPVVAVFQYEQSDEKGPGIARTMIPADRQCEFMRDMNNRAATLASKSKAFLIAETIVTNDDGSKHIHSRVVR